MVDNILCNGFLLNLFFQNYAVDIKTIPDALMGQVALLSELLKDTRASTAVRKYIHGF